MTLSGPQALKSLDNAVRDIRDEENKLASRLTRGSDRIAKLRDTEADLFRQLATIRLTSDLSDTMSRSLSGAERKAHQMLAEYADSIETTKIRLEGLDEEVADHARNRRTLLEIIDQSQDELKSLSGKIAQTIAKDPAYEERRKTADTLGQIADESMRKTETAEADREQKGRPYRDDSLFMYLWSAGYGTKNYKASNLVRWLDSMVAKLIGFYDARPNFAMLNEIPIRLREHAERQASAAHAAEEALDALEQDAIDAAGGKPVREALVSAQTQLETADKEMATIEDQRDELARTYRHLAEGRSPAFEGAAAILVESFEQQNVQDLLARARETSGHQDDAIVKQVDDIRDRIVDEEEDASEHKGRLRTLANRRRELEDIEWEFKKAHFDDPRSTFREDNLAGDLLNEFLTGAITAGSYWQHWRSSQNWQAGTTDWGGGIGLPRAGRRSRAGFRKAAPRRSQGRINAGLGGSTGGGFSRPRSGSRGTRTSGGFKTGGGF